MILLIFSQAGKHNSLKDALETHNDDDLAAIS